MARPVDRLEALVLAVLLAAAMGMVAVGLWLGDVVAHGVSARGPHPGTGEYAATATAVEAGRPVVSPVNDGYPLLWRVPVQWTAPTGESRRSVVVLNDAVEAPGPVPVVVNAEGRARAERPAPGQMATKLVVGTVAVLLGWLSLGLLWHAAESASARRRASAWSAAWERFGSTGAGRSR